MEGFKRALKSAKAIENQKATKASKSTKVLITISESGAQRRWTEWFGQQIEQHAPRRCFEKEQQAGHHDE